MNAYLGDSFRAEPRVSDSRGLRGKVVKTPKGGLKYQASNKVRCPSCEAADKVRRRGCLECGGKGTVKAPVRVETKAMEKAKEREFLSHAVRNFLLCGGEIRKV